MSDSFLFSAGGGFPSALCDLSIIEERGHLLALQSHRSKCRRRRPSPRLRLLVHQEHLNVENGETALLRHLWISQCLLSFHSTRFRFLPKRKPKRSPSTPAKMSRPASPTTTRRRRRNPRQAATSEVTQVSGQRYTRAFLTMQVSFKSNTALQIVMYNFRRFNDAMANATFVLQNIAHPGRGFGFLQARRRHLRTAREGN